MAIKRTEEERRAREQKRKMKKEMLQDQKAQSRDDISPGAYIKRLNALFQHDEEEIYNITNNEAILEIVLEMKELLEEKHWSNVIRKAIKMTKVKNKEEAYMEIAAYLD